MVGFVCGVGSFLHFGMEDQRGSGSKAGSYRCVVSSNKKLYSTLSLSAHADVLNGYQKPVVKSNKFYWNRRKALSIEKAPGLVRSNLHWTRTSLLC